MIRVRCLGTHTLTSIRQPFGYGAEHDVSHSKDLIAKLLERNMTRTISGKYHSCRGAGEVKSCEGA